MFCFLILQRAAIWVILCIIKTYKYPSFVFCHHVTYFRSFSLDDLRRETGTELPEKHKFSCMQLKKLCKNSHPPPPIHCTSSTPTFFIGREVFGVRHGSSSLKHLRIWRIKKEQVSSKCCLVAAVSLWGRNSVQGRLVSEGGSKSFTSTGTRSPIFILHLLLVLLDKGI